MELGRLILSFVRDADDQRSRDFSLLERSVAFLEEHGADDKKGSVTYNATSHRSDRNKETVDIDMSGRRFTTPTEIRTVLDLGAIVDPFHGRELLIEMRAATALADCIWFLDALAEVELSSAFETDRVDVIVDALKAWAGSPAVELWRNQRLPRVIEKRFSSLARWLKQGDSSLQRLLSAAEIGASERLQVLAKGVETSGLELGSRGLFGVVELMVADLPPNEAGEVLDWYVRRLSDRLPADTAGVMSLDEVLVLERVVGG